jgi:hypothetical protein
LSSKRPENRQYIIIFPVIFDLRRRLFATLLIALLAAACGTSGTPIDPTPIPPPPPPPPPPPTVNNPPRIVSITSTVSRAEIGEEVTITANVTDDETADGDLTFQWQAGSGTFTGTGLVVTWKAPTADPTPATYKISLVVIEKYVSAGENLEHRVTGAGPEIRVNDSPKEVRALSEQFLEDFSDSSKTPEYCVRNFSDSCPGKRSELKDIIDNRNTYKILESKFSNYRITFNTARTTSNVRVACTFKSQFKQGGAIEIADGTCELSLIYEVDRWWLCNSSYHKLDALGPNFIF